MNALTLQFTLLSDATFGRGDGVAGLVDEEVQHDKYGLPFLNGRTLKGLLRAECAEILYAVTQAKTDQSERWQTAAHRLFGAPGSGNEEIAIMRVSDACLPQDLRTALAEDFRSQDPAQREQKRIATLESLTAVRRQTAMDAESGAPQEETLRTMRVIIRNTPFEATVSFTTPPTQDDLALLAACVKAFRRAGTGRNRGRGRLQAELYDEGKPVTAEHFGRLQQAVKS
jgi:CRISPR/Cas system CSM-associated protein Csm3 (group 7 of RAMP superfamily)